MTNTELDALVEQIKDDIRSGEVGPNIMCRQIDKLANFIAALRQERDAARAELERQNEANDMIARERDAFAVTRKEWVDYCAAAGADLAAARAKNEKLRLDAKRYCFVRDTRSWPWVRDHLWQPISCAEFDAAIDAALRREET
jgi:hypothetical protein